MTEKAGTYRIIIDLNQFKLHLALNNNRINLTLHFNSPSRRFYLSVIALVVNEMKRQGKITSIILDKHHDLLALLNDTVGGSAGSSKEENLLSRIYKKWQYALPNLEEAPLFTLLGRKKGNEEGSGRVYPCTEAERDSWANLFEYKGSHENVRLKFAIDNAGLTLHDVAIIFGDRLNGDAWDGFIASLKEQDGEKQQAEHDLPVPEEPEVLTPPPERKKTFLSGRYRWVALMAGIVFVLGAITSAIWETHARHDPGNAASVAKMALPLPEGPSFAVLPFANISGDPKQEFLCDGMTEGIITALSKVPGVLVIARSSTDTYKGKSVKVKQVSEELGVRYVLEGSVQRSGDRLRITAQLIDALSGNHLWAERYDRDLNNLFVLQDEIIVNVLSNVQGKLMPGAPGAEKSAEKYYRGKQGLDCFLKLIEAMDYAKRWTVEDNNLARRKTEEAIAMCPENPMGYAFLGWIYHIDFTIGNTQSRRETVEKGIEMAQKALAMDDSIASTHALLAFLYLNKYEHDKAIAEAERAMALGPAALVVLDAYAINLTYAGRPKEAIPIYQKAIRLAPLGPAYLYREFALALRDAGQFAEAISTYKKALHLQPNDILAHAHLAVTYSMMGRDKEARAEAAEVFRRNPKLSWANFSTYKDQSQNNKIRSAWRKAEAEASAQATISQR